MNEISLSVAVATCGRPKALATCLDALAKQTRAPAQVIVVDQAPCDETRNVIAQCGMTVDYRQQEKRGLSASRNMALSAATGSFLAVTDDDCFPAIDWIESITSALGLSPDLDAVTGPILPPDGPAPQDMCALSLRPSRETRLYSSRSIPWAVGSGANFSVRVELLNRIGGWDERLGVGTRGLAAEDCEIMDRVLANGGSILYDGNVAVHHSWQTRERRKATRWSYGYGIGALCGLRLARRDNYAFRMLASYSKMHLLGMRDDLGRGDWTGITERITALRALPSGCLYGVRA